VILLTTNLLKKELKPSTQSFYAQGLAINCVANIVTNELAVDLLPEVTALLGHPQAYIRKKAVLCLYKMFLKYPPGLRLTFGKLQPLLKDPEPSVISCAVNVVTELAYQNPSNYLFLAPDFFDLLTSSVNNWMLIKIVKLLSRLVPEEPRLARKLLGPLADMVKNTQAKSLQFEAVYTITRCLEYTQKVDGSQPANVPDILALCAHTLTDLMHQDDPNLHYLGLVGLSSLHKQHPVPLTPQLLTKLSDPDVTIRSRVLELLPVTADNLQAVVEQLVPAHVTAATGEYRQTLVQRVLQWCTQDRYRRVTDFAWYWNLLIQLGRIRSVTQGHDLAYQLQNVALRVQPERNHAVSSAYELLCEQHGSNDKIPYLNVDLLPSLAWTVGEYADELLSGSHLPLLKALLMPSHAQNLVPSTLQKYVTSALMVFCAAAQANATNLHQCLQVLTTGLSVFVQSTNPQVMQRSFMGLRLLQTLQLVPDLVALDDNSEDDEEGDLLGMGSDVATKTLPLKTTSSSLASRIRKHTDLLSYIYKPSPMKPISAKAQRKIRDNAIKEPVDFAVFDHLVAQEEAYRQEHKLTLDSVSFTQQTPVKAVAQPPPSNMGSMQGFGNPMQGIGSDHVSSSDPRPFQSNAQTSSVAPSRAGDPFYLNSGPSFETEQAQETERFGTTIQLDDSYVKVKSKKKKKDKKKKSQDLDIFGSVVATTTSASTQAPAAVVYDSDDDEDDTKKSKKKKQSGLASVDLRAPLRDDEVIPQRQHYTVTSQPSTKEKKSKKKKKAKASEAPSEGDLLNLGVAPTPATATMPASGNAISTAFEDLLGIEATPAPALPGSPFDPMVSTLAGGTAPLSNSSHASLVPRMRASIKASKSSNSVWKQVALEYKCEPVGGSLALTFAVRNMSSLPLTNVSLELKGRPSIDLKNVTAGSEEWSESSISLPSPGAASLEMRGSLSASGDSVSIKILLPISATLRSEVGKHIEEVATELGMPGWFSSSVKLDVSDSFVPAQAKVAVAAFLCASEVVDPNSTAFVGTLACQSAQGVPVRVMIKVKSSSIKLDVKARSEALAKSICSDLKRIGI